MKIAICMPTAAGSVYAKTMESVMATAAVLAGNGVAFRFFNIDGCEIVAARNELADHVRRDASFTHLLFVDYDMVFSPMVAKRLIEARRPLIGCAYPKRELDFDAVEAVAARAGDEGLSLRKAAAIAAEYVVRPERVDGRARVRVRNGLARVAGVGMGLTLIAREVLDGLVASGTLPVVRRRLAPDATEPTHGFFVPTTGDGGRELSEDLSFCERWRRDCNGEVWCNVADEIGHLGRFAFRGAYMDKIAFSARHPLEIARAGEAERA